jgi:hypothetical protein
VLRCTCSAAASYLGIGTLQFSESLRVDDALYPSKSGLTNKHTVKQIVLKTTLGTQSGTCASCESGSPTVKARSPMLTKTRPRGKLGRLFVSF